MSTFTEFDKQLDYDLKSLLIGDEDGYEDLKKSIKQAVDKYVIGSDFLTTESTRDVVVHNFNRSDAGKLNDLKKMQRQSLWGDK